MRVSAREAAVPSGFLLDSTAKSLYHALSLKERDTPKIRIAIGEMSAGLLERDKRRVASAARTILECVESSVGEKPTPRKHVIVSACRTLGFGFI